MSGDYSFNTQLCYYNKQTCSKGGIKNKDIEGEAEGKTISELTSGGFFNTIAAGNWSESEGRYPIPKGLEENEAAIVGAAPIFFANIEGFKSVINDFRVSTSDGVTWTSSNPSIVSISGAEATIKAKGTVTLIATKGSATRTVEITVIAMPGAGTEATPFEINNKEELIEFCNDINNNIFAEGATGLHFKLMSDIDLGGETDGNWTPIGGHYSQFKGHFDGNGKTINNLYINAPSDYQGFFGYVGKGGEVKNLNIINANITGKEFIGGIIGYNQGTIASCIYTGKVNGVERIGGIIGVNYGTITKCANIGNVTGEGKYIGGVTGISYGLVSLCTNSGNVTGDSNVGGITGSVVGSIITSCLNRGSITGNNYYSGIAGELYYSTSGDADVSFCYDDRQMCNGYTTNSKHTADFLSGKFFNSEDWSESEGRYPIQKGLEENEAAIVGATPILFANVEGFNSVINNFRVSTADGVTWTSSDPSIVSISGTDATIKAKGTVTLTATKGSVSRTVEITVIAMPGTGTEATPFEINNKEEFIEFCNDINYNKFAEGATGLHFKLMSDIDLGGETNGNWTPIGNYKRPFKGHFEGNGRTISNLYINALTSDYQGLFGNVGEGGEVKNLNLVNTSVTGRSNVGSVVGENHGNITSCTNSGSIVGTSEHIGGIVGTNYDGTVTSCINYGSVNGNEYVGGIVGIEIRYNSGTVDSCFYDRQLCPFGGVMGEDTEGAVGNLTSELTSGKFLNAEDWSESEGRYPIPKGLEENEAAIVGAAPIFFANLEGFKSVINNFRVGTVGGITWTSSDPSIISILGADATIKAKGTVALTATKGSTSKTMMITVVAMPGSGTEAAPFEIYNREDLIDFCNDINKRRFSEGATGLHFKLMANIDLGGEANGSWIPIGNRRCEFKGRFDGNGKTISNLYVNSSNSSYQGFFGNVGEGGEVKNLNLVNANVTGDKNEYAGTVAAVNSGIITSCFSTGNVTGGRCIGGISGFNYGTIASCIYTGSVTGTEERVGGISGYNSGTITSCIYTGSVTGIEEGSTGGIFGGGWGSITLCYYDKQMCVVDRGGTGKLTIDMLGNGLKDVLDPDVWVFSEGLYPRLKCSESTDASIIAATPIYLSNDERVNDVMTNFTLGNCTGATWTVSPAEIVTLSGSNATLASNGDATLTLTKGNVSKHIKLTISILTNRKQLTASKPTLTLCKSYNGTNEAYFKVGVLENVDTDDDIELSAIATYDNKNVGTCKTITVKYSISGENARKYIRPVNYIVQTGEIKARKLYTNKPEVTTSKEYDGNVIAVVTPGTLENVISNEIVILKAIALYENSSIGSCIPITVKYTLEGKDSGNYIAPEDYTTTGEITGGIIVGDITKPAAVCSGDGLSLTEPLVENGSFDYTGRWELSNDGFLSIEDYTGRSLSEADDGWMLRYVAVSSFGDRFYSNEVPIEVNLSPKYVERLWDDILACYNTREIQFVSWQWYKDGSPVSAQDASEGQFANRPYIRITGNASEYQLEATTSNGRKYYTCPLKAWSKSKQVALKAYPNPSLASEPLKIEVDGMDDEMLEGAVLTVYSTAGVKVLQLSDVRHTSEIRLPQGIYVVALSVNGRTLSTKAIRR